MLAPAFFRFPTRRLALLALLALALGGGPDAHAAGDPSPIVFQSATAGPYTAGGQTLKPTQFVGTRFTTTRDYIITSVGADLEGAAGGTTFLAVTPIAGASAFPDPQLSGSLFQGLVTVAPSADQDYTLGAHFLLPAGTYALTAGGGLFGATGVNAAPNNNPEVAGGGDFILYSPSQDGQFLATAAPNSGTRFFLRGFAPPGPARRYTITGLGSLSAGSAGVSFNSASAINGGGQVVGTSDVTDPSGNHGYDAFLYSGGRMTDLGNFGTGSGGFFGSSAYGINGSGQVVGVGAVGDPASNQGAGQAAFLYSGGALINLGNFGTDAQGIGASEADGINDAGQIVGSSAVYDSSHTDFGSSAFLYSGGRMTNLGGLGADAQGRYNSHARAINKSGQVAGSASVFDGSHAYKGDDAFLYSGGKMADLGNLGTNSQGSGLSIAYGINDAGQVVGESEVYDATHADRGLAAFLYSGGRMTSLGGLGTDSRGNGFSFAQGINNAGQVVGTAHVYDAAHAAHGQDGFLYTGGTLYALSGLITNGTGWADLQAAAISDAGQIAGTGTHDGRREAFLLTPQSGHTHVLWANTSGQASLWDYDAGAGTFTQTTYGPYPGWSAKAVSDGPDRKTRVLWTTAAGQASLWSLDAASGLYAHSEFGPYPGWTATQVSVGPDNVTHLLWTSSDGRLSLWNADAAGGTFTQNSYGPYPGWSARAIADGPDGRTRVLWDNADGRLSLWSLDSAAGSFTQHTSGPFAGWTAGGASVGPDNTTHVLWANASGQSSLWDYDAAAGTYGYKNYGPYAGWSAQALADGPDGRTDVLWATAAGQVSLWGLDNKSGLYAHHEFGPYPGWSAVALSAGP